MTMGAGEVTVKVTVVRGDFNHHQKGFGIMQYELRGCAHDIDLSFDVRMTMNQWQHVGSLDETFILFQAELKGRLLDATVNGSGIMTSPSMRITGMGDDVHMTAEFFSGGFSGWSHALRRLCDMGFKVIHRFALDIDAECVDAYSKAHGFKHVCGPDSFVWNDDVLPEYLLFHADVRNGAWYHLIGNYVLDMLMMSPPCPPWSKATAALGFMRDEGRLTIDAICLCNLIRPKVILFENVAAMKEHEQWAFIRDLFSWCGYSIRFAKCLNLTEMAPQNRDRLIIVATLDGADLQPYICVGWPQLNRTTMETFDCIMPMDEPWRSQSRIEKDVLQMYMSPSMLPKVNSRNKRSKVDVEHFRLRFIEGTFGCTMANYGYSHLLPQSSLQNMSLFGTLLVTAEAIRFLALPEVLMLMGALVSCWLPDNHRVAMKMLGNGISTQHALIAIGNGLAFLRDLSQVEVHELVMEALSTRMTASNIRWERKWGGFSFSIDALACRPTLLMHEINEVSVKCPTECIRFFTERGVYVLEVLKLLTGDAMPSVISLLPGGDMDFRVSVPNRFEVKAPHVQLFADVPTALRVQTSAFHSSECHAPCIIILSAKGTFVLKRDQGMTVADVLLTMNHHMSVRCLMLVGILGDAHEDDALCPNVVIARDYISGTDNLQMMDFIRIEVNHDCVLFHAAHQSLKMLVELFQKIGIDEMMAALGWIIVIDADAFVTQDVKCLKLIKSPGSLALIHDDMVYCFALHLFLARIRNWADIGHNPSIHCRIKLWGSWIWDGFIDANLTLEHFDRVWNMISGWFNIRKPWRYVANGRTVNPAWPLHGFFTTDDEGVRELKVFMLLGMHGGGPANLRSVSQVRANDTGSFGHIADFEARDFRAAMKHVMQKFDDTPTQIRFDITLLLELEMTFMEGLMCLKGDYEKLRSFLDLMIRSGLERILAFCGWMVACHYTAVYQPIEAQVLFFRKPCAPAVTEDFVRVVIHNALVIFGLPVPVTKHDAIKTKVKLEGVNVFHDMLPRDLPMQDLLDVWDQASTISGYDRVVRLVSHTGCTVNPDFSLRHYSKCGPDEESIATVSFSSALHGGGLSDKKVSNQHDLMVQQKNALASFLISQGVELQTCVTFIDSVVKSAGADAVATILNQRQHNKKWSGLMQLAEAMGIPTPNISTKSEKAKKRLQSKVIEQTKQLEKNLPIELLKLQDGFLINVDETYSAQLAKVQPNTSGVVLSRYQDAKPWIESGHFITQDELSLIVIGRCWHANEEDCEKIRVPVLLNDEPLVVSGCLHHLGMKRASVSLQEQDEFPVNETQVLSITAYKDEMQADAWALITKAPVKHMLQILSHEAGDVNLLSPPWDALTKGMENVVMQSWQPRSRFTSEWQKVSFEDCSKHPAVVVFTVLPKLRIRRS